MKVVILCGGKGTRLREETEYRPKPMVPIGARPILWHIMKFYAHYGHREFILCLGYKGEMIKDYFRNYLWQTCDVTLMLGRNPAVAFHDRHAEEDWSVTLADTGLESMTGYRIRLIKRFIPAGETARCGSWSKRCWDTGRGAGKTAPIPPPPTRRESSTSPPTKRSISSAGARAGGSPTPSPKPSTGIARSTAAPTPAN